jgi:hypothetical protein
MKMIIALVVGLMSVNAMADQCPCHKKPVAKKKPASCQVRTVVKTVVVEKPVVKVVEKVVEKKIAVVRTVVKRKMNLVQIMGGVGPNGIDAQRNGTAIEAEQKYGAVGGLGYSRRLGEDSDLLLGVQGLTNKTGMVSLGIEF